MLTWFDRVRLRALRSTGELARCSDSQLRSLLPHGDDIAVRAGYRFAVEGRPCNEFLIVIEGRLRAVSAHGAYRDLESGDSWGWDAMWQRSMNEATVVAESDARVLVMGHAQFRAVKAVTAPPDANAQVVPAADRDPKATLREGLISAAGRVPPFIGRRG
jgi:CRP-like cAMP-binding protein